MTERKPRGDWAMSDREIPLRDWSLSRFEHLDRPTLGRLHRHLGLDPRDTQHLTKRAIAIGVFMYAHDFGTFTLADFFTLTTEGNNENG